MLTSFSLPQDTFCNKNIAPDIFRFFKRSILSLKWFSRQTRTLNGKDIVKQRLEYCYCQDASFVTLSSFIHTRLQKVSPRCPSLYLLILSSKNGKVSLQRCGQSQGAVGIHSWEMFFSGLQNVSPRRPFWAKIDLEGGKPCVITT